MITSVWTFYHSSYDDACFDYHSRETSYAKHSDFDLQSLSPALRNLSLLLVNIIYLSLLNGPVMSMSTVMTGLCVGGMTHRFPPDTFSAVQCSLVEVTLKFRPSQIKFFRINEVVLQ